MAAHILTIARLTWLEAFRNRLLWLVLAALLIAFGLAEFLGSLAITESVQMRAVLLAALLRVFAVVVVSLFVISSGVRELDEKATDLLLSLPVSRASYYFGKLLGFSGLALLMALLCAVAAALYAPPGQAALWAMSLGCELLIVVAFSLLCMFTFHQVTVAVSVVLGFYVLSRSMAAIQLVGSGPFADSGGLSQRVMTTVIDAIAYVLPSLDRFTPSEWLAYHTGQWHELLHVAGQTGVYLMLLAGAGLFDLYRKSF
jgi:ABC-type transport system involved in multi-copper enzyme maturation permease subunit